MILIAGTALLLRGKNLLLLSPAGLVARQQRQLLVFATIVLLEIAVPTLFILYYFAWKYRESAANDSADAAPVPTSSSRFLWLGLWFLPTIFMVVLGTFMWLGTHQLPPQKAVSVARPPLSIQVIALRWKWLFIYPEQGIATVNYVQLPVNRPVQFELTADEAPMSSFWIPQLGGQLYAMTGHSNQLNLLPEREGRYSGRSAEINGQGFADMVFTADVRPATEFNAWADGVRQKTSRLNAADYQRLLGASQSNPPATYALTEAGLYKSVLAKYADGAHHRGGYQ